MKKSPWTHFLLALTALKLLGGVIGFAIGLGAGQPGDETAYPPLVRCLLLLAFALTGLFLLGSGRDDRRAVHLGSFFFLLASAYSNRPLRDLVNVSPPHWAWPALFLFVLPVDAFLPFFAWEFTQEFPNSVSSFKVQRLLTLGGRVSLGAGAAGFLWQVLRLVVSWARASSAAAPELSLRSSPAPSTTVPCSCW